MSCAFVLLAVKWPRWRVVRMLLVLLACARYNGATDNPTPPKCTTIDTGTFCVAEVKPHFQCRTSDGQARVRKYVEAMTGQGIGLIALIQVEFTLPKPEGYISFGASCTRHSSDPVVVLVDQNQFSIASGLGETSIGNYTSMPYLADGKHPESGSMCVGDPSIVGSRGYAGALLRHTATGEDVCVIAGTLPHCYGAWQPMFLQNIQQRCVGRRLLLIVDTNAACELEGPSASRRVSMQDMAQRHSANWGRCSDPAADNPAPTCCHDISKGHPEARYWYDRTTLCGGGVVTNFQVHDDFVCGSDAEHKYTSAVVNLADPPLEIITL